MLKKKWGVSMLQGLLMIILSIVIFNNPGAVLETISLWLGIIVLLVGLAGLASYFTDKASKENSNLLWSLVITVIGIFMVTKIVFTQMAITVMFGLIVTAVGFMLIMDSINIRKDWSKWWILAISGIIIIVMGITSIFSLSSGAENISALIGVSVLMSGIGLIVLSILKKSLVNLVKGNFN